MQVSNGTTGSTLSRLSQNSIVVAVLSLLLALSGWLGMSKTSGSLDMNEEKIIFDSLEATAVDQSAYEKKIVEQSEESGVSSLLVTEAQWGFPPRLTQELLPGEDSSPSINLSMLKNTRSSLELPPVSAQSNPDVLAMKRYILEHAIGEVEQMVKTCPKPVPNLKRMDESELASSTEAKPAKKARVSIMERKQVDTKGKSGKRPNPRTLTKEEERKLQQLRYERKLRQQQRRARIVDESSSESEPEFKDEEEDDASNDSESGGATSAPLSVSGAITCPICKSSLHAPEGEDGDEFLARHMSNCTGRPSRQTRQRTSMSSASAPAKKPKERSKRKRVVRRHTRADEPLDDSNLEDYEDRVDAWMQQPHDEAESQTLPGGLWAPPWIYSKLFPYQRVGFEWMWRLHQEGNGGIVGDEMGLGKTVQVCAFLGAAAASRKLKSVLIVAPGTLLEHWLRELEIWAPGLRRILARTEPPPGTLQAWLKNARKERWNEALDDQDWEEKQAWCGTGYCVVTTYEQLRRNIDTYCLQHTWSYMVLDEAQHIRNPDADITMACKQVRTRHRLAMTGTPIQNDLRELWSLVDFCFPGRLGRK